MPVFIKLSHCLLNGHTNGDSETNFWNTRTKPPEVSRSTVSLQFKRYVMNTLTIESKTTCIAIGWGYCLQNLNCILNLITDYTSIPSSAIFVILTHNSDNMKLYSSYPELITFRLKVWGVTWPAQTGLFIVSCGRKIEDSENEARLSKGGGRGRWCFYTSHPFSFTFKTLFTLDSLKRNPNIKLI